jgi:DNA-binding beta-propeller fold protein YncE
VIRPVAGDRVTDQPSTARSAQAVGQACRATVKGRPRRASGERVLFAILLVGAALVRLLGPGQLEPNVSTAEVANLAGLESVLSGQGPGLLARVGVGASGLALLPAALLRSIRPEPELAIRLYAALGSLAFVALVYALCRSRFPPVVSLTATALLAFAPWSIYFGRNGELNALVGAWAAVAILALDRARPGGPRRWLLAGAVAAAGLYWHPSAIWLLPALVLAIIAWGVADRAGRPRLAVALGMFLAAGLLVAAPRAPGLLDGPISTAGLLAEQGAQPEPSTAWRARAQEAGRAFFLLDPTVPGDRRYQPPGSPPLDGLTGLLLLGGVALAAWNLPTSALPLTLFLVPLAASQLASPRVPSLADAVVAFPALYLLVAASLEWLVAVLPFPSITRAALLVAIPAYAAFGWQSYSGWIGSAAGAQARQPALDYDEVDAWIAEQRTRLAAGQPAATAQAWRDEHPRLTTGSRVIRRPRSAGPAPAQDVVTRLALQPAGSIAGERGPLAPRGVAATPAGDVYVSDATGQLSRLDLARNALVPLQQRTPPLEQASDLAAGPDGFLYLADAERSLVMKLSPTGELVATIGGDWGMYRPRGLDVGPDGRLYVADTGRNRIAVGRADGRLQKSIVPPTSFGAFEQPTDVAVDSSGRIYVGLPEIGRLAVLDESGQVLGGWAIPRGNTIESSRLAVVVDGAIAMTDLSQARVRLLDADGRELAVADAPGRPMGLAVADGRLFVGEPAGGRVLVYTLGAP